MHTGSPASPHSTLAPQQKKLAQEAKLRPPNEAAALLAEHPAAEAATVLMELNPGFAQDILQRACRRLPPRSVPRRAAGHRPAVGTQPDLSPGQRRPPDGTGVSRYSVRKPRWARPSSNCARWSRTRFITYGYVTEAGGRLAGIVTMRDLLFAESAVRLDAIMLRDAFCLHPERAARRRDETRARPPLPGLSGVRRNGHAARAGARPGDVRGAGISRSPRRSAAWSASRRKNGW